MCRNEIDKGKRQQNAAEDQKRHRRTNRRNGNEGRSKGADDTADRIEGTKRTDDAAAVFQTINRIFGKRRRHCSQKKQRKHEQNQTCRKGRPHEIVGGNRKDHKAGKSRNDILSKERDQHNPDCRNQNAAIEAVRIRILVRALSAVYISKRHRNHDGSDNDRPHNLGRTEIRCKQTAGPEFYRHHGHTAEKLCQIQKQMILQQLSVRLIHRPTSFR